MATSKQLQEYLVMQVDYVPDKEMPRNSAAGALSKKVKIKRG